MQHSCIKDQSSRLLGIRREKLQPRIRVVIHLFWKAVTDQMFQRERDPMVHGHSKAIKIRAREFKIIEKISIPLLNHNHNSRFPFPLVAQEENQRFICCSLSSNYHYFLTNKSHYLKLFISNYILKCSVSLKQLWIHEKY